MDRKEALELIAACGGNKTAAAAKAKMPRSTFLRLVRDRVERSEMAGRSLGEFRNLYDKGTIVPRRIREALRKMGPSWRYEAEFIKLAEVSAQDLAAFRDQFAEHVVALNRDTRRAWAGTTEMAKKMREMV